MSKKVKVSTPWGEVDVEESATKIRGYFNPCVDLPKGTYFNSKGDLAKRDAKGKEVIVEKQSDRIARQQREAKQGK